MSERNIYIEDIRAIFDKLVVSNLTFDELFILANAVLSGFSDIETKYILRY